MIRLEWNALKHEAAGTLAADKVALDARRLFGRFLAEFERTLRQPSPAERPPSLAEHLGRLAARREGTTA
jgi:hypothetical protein